MPSRGAGLHVAGVLVQAVLADFYVSPPELQLLGVYRVVLADGEVSVDQAREFLRSLVEVEVVLHE